MIPSRSLATHALVLCFYQVIHVVNDSTPTITL